MADPKDNARRVRPRTSIKAITKDENRREEAERDLVEGLRSYINKLPEAKDRDPIRETEIFCGYARVDYDSSAEAFLDGRPSADTKTRFEIGDFSEPQVLIGWPTNDRVRALVKRVTVPRPAHWPFHLHSEDSLEMRRVILQIVQSAPETFEWLLETPSASWFEQQLRECLNECIRAKREEYELRFPNPPEQSRSTRPKLAVGANTETIATGASGVGRGAARWQSLEIWFLSDERVEIRNGANTETRNYGELGLEDGRTGKPSQAWETLRVIAEQNGIIKDGAKTGVAWSKVEKRIQEIRKALRKHFSISADPIPFVKGMGYRACFKIGCRASFQT